MNDLKRPHKFRKCGFLFAKLMINSFLIGGQKMKHTAKRISSGEYVYRGYKIIRFGYHPPDHSVIWEGVNDEGDADAHGHSKRHVMREIDYLLDNK